MQHYQNLNGEDICTVNTTLPIFIDGNIAGAVEIAKDYSTVQKLTDTIVDLQSKIKRSSRKSGQKDVAFETIVTNDARFKQTKELAQKVAPTDANVLIYGKQEQERVICTSDS